MNVHADVLLTHKGAPYLVGAEASPEVVTNKSGSS